jgi:asparagine synthase (glutamine-hydrolysing)
MSGIVGLVNLDGAPVDRRLLGRMTGFMKFRGPDAQHTWVNGYVGFGHTLLRTTDEAAREEQPFSLDGETWIVADARVDGQAELIAALRAKGREVQAGVPDCELILHAYHAWGEECVERLIGDFAFAIWDGRERRLFCARDHFGIKPFFYALVGGHLVFSNTLQCVREHPAVSSQLDDLFIADFLLFGYSHEASASAFADVRRLPSAHTLVYEGRTVRVRRFWALKEDYELLRYRRARDYVDHFHEVLDAAVSDRLRTDRLSISLSGGLDAPAVAALARKRLAERGAAELLRGFTVAYEQLIPDEEGHYSAIVARHLGIKHEILNGDAFLPFEGLDQPGSWQAEPTTEPRRALAEAFNGRMASHSRVALTGLDGDTILSEWSKPWFHHLLRQRKVMEVARGIVWFAARKHQLPRIGVRHWLRQRARRDWKAASLPVWLDETFAKRLKLAERVEAKSNWPVEHPTRPRPYRVINAPYWVGSFEWYDAGSSRIPLEFRHPLADLRVVDFALALPPVPWLVEKEIVRLAMRGLLPDQIVARPKRALAADPITASIRQGQVRWLDSVSYLPVVSRYVNCRAIPAMLDEANAEQLCVNLRPLQLNAWLRSLQACSQARPEVALALNH